MNGFQNDCQQRRASLCLLASGALPESEAQAVKAHLAECAECRGYFQEIQTMTQPLAGWEETFADIEPTFDVQNRWERAVKSANLKPTMPTGFLLKAWMELVWPCRRIWAALAVVWMGVLMFNAAQPGPRQPVIAKSRIPAGEIRLAYQEQQRVLAELIGPPPSPPTAEPARRSNTEPRSEWRTVSMA